MKYVVTGAAGFIGSHLAESLQEAGHAVVGIDSFTDYYDPALKERNARVLNVRRLDLAEDELDFAGVDGIFHLAGQPGVRSFGDVFPLYVRRNVLASQRVFEAAAAAGTRVVFASTSTIYGEAERYPTPEETQPLPISPYGITKLTCEHLARAYGRSFELDAVVLRYFSVYGPRQRPDMSFPRVFDALLGGVPFTLFGDGEQSRSFTFVADVVDASILAMERAAAGSTFNVGGGEEATMNETIALLERVAGRRLDLRRGEAVAGDQRRNKADTTRILDELGWAPKTSLEQGLRAQWDWASREAAEIESPA
ncbi:MAG: NAD-dependent epimerase/dehydratase family protein [Gaiellaceae bacterium MAG52_C11]|nr:NAD-dependent epimerase/dehydratase family protein [Candidatus Gaiellasilicea maunaloa]